MENINKIKNDIRPVLEAFLSEEKYFAEFQKIAKVVGYQGDDPNMIKMAMISIKDGDFGFVAAELNDMFFEYQIISQVKDVEPFKSALEKNPDKTSYIVGIARRILNGEEITSDDMNFLM